MGTVSLQAARLDGVATTTSIGVGWTEPLGDAGGLPAMGEEISSEVSSWLLAFGVGLGVSVAGDRGDEDAFTANGHLGLLCAPAPWSTRWAWWRTGTWSRPRSARH